MAAELCLPAPGLFPRSGWVQGWGSGGSMELLGAGTGRPLTPALLDLLWRRTVSITKSLGLRSRSCQRFPAVRNWANP
jgi:hypothetical protein